MFCKCSTVIVPDNVGLVFNTTEPEPVDVVVPVPPRKTAKVPYDMLDAFNDVKPDPGPDIVPATVNWFPSITFPDAFKKNLFAGDA